MYLIEKKLNIISSLKKKTERIIGAPTKEMEIIYHSRRVFAFSVFPSANNSET